MPLEWPCAYLAQFPIQCNDMTLNRVTSALYCQRYEQFACQQLTNINDEAFSWFTAGNSLER